PNWLRGASASKPPTWNSPGTRWNTSPRSRRRTNVTSLTTTTSTSASQPALTSRREARKPGFQNVLAAEWVKFTSLRSTWITLGLGVALAIAMTVMMSTAIGGSWDPENKMYAEFNPITWSMDATLIATIAFSVLGVSVAAGEYTSGMIRLSLMATPRRGSILAA